MASSEDSSRHVRRAGDLRAVARGHRGILAVALVALFPLFANLGAGTLWADEADTAVFARSILKAGLPTAWDGTTFTDSDSGRRLAPNLVLVGTPWVPYYVTAASLALFGETSFAARFPFAVAGLATLLLLYALVLRLTGDRLAAVLSSGLLLSSVQFLIYVRQSRHYALNMLLSVGLLFAFQRLERRRPDPLFIALAVLLYHCHPMPAGVTLAVLGGLTLLSAFRAARWGFWLSFPLIVLLTAPWAVLAAQGWGENSRALGVASDYVPRFVQFLYEASVAVPFVGLLVLAPFAARQLGARDRRFLTLAVAVLAGYALLAPLAQSTLQLWEYGLRYSNAFLPLGAAVTALLIARAARGKRAVAIWIAALFACTHLPGNTALWMLIPPRPAPEERPAEPRAALHMPAHAIDEILRTEVLAFARELVAWSPGTDSRIVAFLEKNAKPGDIVVTNYAWEPLYFHTRLPQGYKVMESHSIYAAAKAAGLPAYVYEPDEARWLVWRAPWEDYQGYRWAEVAARLRAAGGTLQPVATFPETVWENRENLHFRRFPVAGYLYPRAVETAYPAARIWRVDHAVAPAADPAAVSPR
jgi:hypothetical protein